MNLIFQRIAAFVALALVFSGVARAQDAEPIAPDRPGFTNGSGTVAPGNIIFENGLARTHDKGSQGGGVTSDFPETLIRVGATSNLEFQIGVPNYALVRGGGSGFGDALLGLKYRFYQSGDGKTRASVAPAIAIPFGAHTQRTPHVDPLVIVGVDRSLGQKANFAANLVLSYPSEFGAQDSTAAGGGANGADGANRNGRNFTVTPAVSLGYSLSGKLSVYADTYTIVPHYGASASVVDGGFAYLLTNDVQLDIEAGAGVGGVAPDNFVGAGLSFRF